jgi:hypothetical protein
MKGQEEARRCLEGEGAASGHARLALCPSISSTFTVPCFHNPIRFQVGSPEAQSSGASVPLLIFVRTTKPLRTFDSNRTRICCHFVQARLVRGGSRHAIGSPRGGRCAPREPGGGAGADPGLGGGAQGHEAQHGLHRRVSQHVTTNFLTFTLTRCKTFLAHRAEALKV